MSNMVNEMIIENLFDEVEQMSMSEMAFEVGQPWRAIAIREDAKLCAKRQVSRATVLEDQNTLESFMQ